MLAARRIRGSDGMVPSMVPQFLAAFHSMTVSLLRGMALNGMLEV